MPVSEVTIAGHLSDMFRTLTPANDLAFRYGTNAPTAARRRADRCRSADTDDRRGSRKTSRQLAVREAGQIALRYVRAPT